MIYAKRPTAISAAAESGANDCHSSFHAAARREELAAGTTISTTPSAASGVSSGGAGVLYDTGGDRRRCFWKPKSKRSAVGGRLFRPVNGVMGYKGALKPVRALSRIGRSNA